MSAEFFIDKGRDTDYDWERGLFKINGQKGLFSHSRLLSDADGTGKSSVSVSFRDVTLTFLSSGNDLAVTSGRLTGGNVTSIEMQTGGENIIHLTGLAVTAATAQALLNHGATDGRDPFFQAVFASAPTTFHGPAEGGGSFFGSAQADEYFLAAPVDGYAFNYVWTGGGSDTVHGSTGEDFVDYAASNKALTISFGSGTVVKSNGVSLGTFDAAVEDVAGSKYNDLFMGDANDNRMFGNDGNDTLKGGGGSDYYEGGKGKDKFVGGNQFDKVSYSHEEGGVGIKATFTGNGGIKVVDTYGGTDTGTHIDDIKGSNRADQFYGSNGGDQAEGMGGADNFDMRGGSDRVDYYHEVDAGTTRGVIVNLSTEDVQGNIGFGTKTVHAGDALDSFGTTDTLSSVEEIVGTRYKDVIVGGGENNFFDGFEGNDRIEGGNGENDMHGGDGNDTIIGGNGQDHISGDGGNDSLIGGGGEDDFNFNEFGTSNADTIVGFQSGKDQIWLIPDAFGLGTGDLQANQFLKGSGLHEAATSDQRIIYDTDTGKLYFDHDGIGGDAAEIFATLKGHPALSFHDFQLG